MNGNGLRQLPGALRRRWMIWLLVSLLVLALGLYLARGRTPVAVFVSDVSGLDSPVLADSRGRLLYQGPARPQRLAADRWLAVDFEGEQSLWLDARGRILRRGPYVELREPLQRHPDDPEQTPLFSVWSRQGMALLRSDGSALVDWQPGYGEWAATGHPQRYSWQPREGGELIFDARGRRVLALDENHWRVAGPFAGQALYLVCGYDEGQPCQLRDEAGAVRWQAPLDDLLALRDDRWLGRSLNAWFVLDAQGQRVDAQAYVDGQYLPQRRSAAAVAAQWPRWMIRYNLLENGEPDVGSAVGGFLQEDGRFDAVPGARQAEVLCPGTWRLSGEDGQSWLADSHGRRFAAHTDHSWQALEQHPQRYLAYTADGRDALVDCRAQRLFDDPAVRDLEPMGGGFAGLLGDEQQPRLWLDAELRRQLLPEGSAIRAASPDGRLLLVAEQEQMRLYDSQRQAFVGAPFEHAEAPFDQGLVFNRGGYYGFMDADGHERLAARHSEISLWGTDRLWSRRYVDHHGEQASELGLHRLDGSLIARWADALANPLQTWQGSNDTQAVAQVYGKTFHTEQGAYFPQQWVDRDGRTLMTALQCPGEDPEAVLADGPARLESAAAAVVEEGGSCHMPAAIRAAIAAQPGAGQ